MRFTRLQQTRLRLLFLLFAVACVCAPALAQSQRGQLHLEVHDTDGGGLGARCELVSESNGFRRAFQIPADGKLLLQNLPLGVYRLSVNAEGFAAATEQLELRSEVPVRLSLTLGVAPVTTQIEVHDELTLLDPTRAATQYSVGSDAVHEQLSAQPGRSLFDLVNDQPGWLYEANGVLHPRGSEYDVQFVVDGQPLTQNRSAAFAPDTDSGSVDSLRVLTAGFPAEYGRKLGGVVEVSTDNNLAQGWHGEFEASGGQFDDLQGSAALSFARGKNTYTARAFGLHSDRYLDPPVPGNFSNFGNSGGISGSYERDFSDNDRLRILFTQNSLRYAVPNDYVQQAAGQRQDAFTSETSGQIYYQHTISPAVFLSVAGSVRDASFLLRSNELATPVIVQQDRGYREGYVRADLAGHKGRHDWKAGIDSFFTPVREALQYRITDASQFDPGTELSFAFRGHRWDVEPSAYVQDQLRLGHWNVSAGLRLDRYAFAVHDTGVSPRVAVSRYIAPLNLLLHATYDRVFQTPAMENLLLASSPELDSVNPVVLRVPVPVARANYYEGGLTKAIRGKLRLDANVFRRDFHNYSDDDVLLQTGVSFPISYAKARIIGEEVRLAVADWGGFSGFLGYSNQSGEGQGPITGGLFIGSDASGALTDTSKFAVSQDQRNSLRARLRWQASRRLWFAAGSQYGSGLPADLSEDTDLSTLIAQYGSAVVSRVNLAKQRVEPNFTLNVGMGAELYRKESRTIEFQLQANNVTDRFNVINFASLFSGTAVGLPRTVSARLRVSF